MVNETNDANFKEDTADGVSVVDFWAPWCGPCKMQSPVIEDLSEDPEVADKIKFFKMNFDDNPNTSREFGIMSIPTIMVLKDGKVIDQIVGFHSKDQLKKLLSAYTA